MKTTKTVPVTYEKEIIEKITCDLCGASTDDEDCWPGKDNRYSANVSLTDGYYYPGDGGSITETIVDICPECFKSKLLPFLVSLGATPRSEKVSF